KELLIFDEAKDWPTENVARGRLERRLGCGSIPSRRFREQLRDLSLALGSCSGRSLQQWPFYIFWRREGETERLVSPESLDLLAVENEASPKAPLAEVEAADDPFGYHLAVEIGNFPLLSRAEEQALAQTMEEGLKAQDKLASLKDPDPEERERLVAVIAAGEQALQSLVEANLRLVVSVAKKYQDRGLELPDLVGSGHCGLLAAVDKFDWRRGFRFATYASWWIRQTITRAIEDGGRTVRIPPWQLQAITEYNRTQSGLKQELRREPTLGELANALGVSMKRVFELETLRGGCLSLDSPVGPEREASLGELLSADQLPPWDELEKGDLEMAVDQLLTYLSDNEAQAVRLRFRLGEIPGPVRTFEEIAAIRGVTSERMRQLVNKGLKKLSQACILELSVAKLVLAYREEQS
ncbi:RNA polymerase sigma factor RpoD/SigA, partial [Patescibacteria group bacterium]